ncbi:MAG: EVE domain-containing protein [Paracoccus sp. (in: a-proteobacteria)]
MDSPCESCPERTYATTPIGTVSREHVLIGVAGGFAMMSHGKLAPLRRLSPGDRLIYYSPKTADPDGAPLQAFTVIGTVSAAEPYQAEIRPGMALYRRDVEWLAAQETPLQSLRNQLEFTRETGECWPAGGCLKSRMRIPGRSALP